MKINLNLNKLNGWQRLWVIFTAIWIVTFLVLSFSNMPQKPISLNYIPVLSEEEILIANNSYNLNIIEKYPDIEALFRAKNIFKKHYSLQDISTLQRDFPLLSECIKRQENIITIEESFYKSRNEWLIFGLFLLILPPLFLYFAGLSFAWVLQGFKKKEKE